MKSVSYRHARENLATLLDEVEDSREEIFVRRRGHDDIALIEASELRSLKETAHLLRSPENALRLLRALTESRAGAKGATFETVGELAAELHFK